MRFGFFDDQRREYVITTPKTPYPWINYLGSEQYCAALTSGVEIPWSAFNTECWMPASGQALSAAPASIALKVQFVASASQACPFTDFCIDSISL